MREPASPAAVLTDCAPMAAVLTEGNFTEAGTPVLTAVVAGSDPVGNSTLRSLLQQTGLVKDLQEWASLNIPRLRHADEVPDVVFLDLSSGMGSEFVFAQELTKLRPAVHIIACSAKYETSPEFLLQAMRSGIRDFLPKPYNRIEVAAMIARLGSESTVQPAKRAGTGRLMAVLGTKGGVGTSTVAVNLAVHLARIPSKKTLLLDFSRPMGDVAALLDLKPKFQVRDALENVKRLDATLFEGLLTAHKSGLKVLCGATRLDVAFGIAHVDAAFRGDTDLRGGMQQRQGMRFAFGHGIAAHDAGGARVEVERTQQRRREPARLVGDHAPGLAARLECDEHLFDAHEQARRIRHMVRVDREKALAQSFENVGTGVGKPQPDQSRRAVRDESPRRTELERFATVFAEQAIQRPDHVRRGVEERTVEVEQDGVDVGHAAGSRSAAGLRRCIR